MKLFFKLMLVMKNLREEKTKIRRRVCDEEITIEEVHGTFKIRKKVSPPSFIYDDKKDDALLRWC